MESNRGVGKGNSTDGKINLDATEQMRCREPGRVLSFKFSKLMKGINGSNQEQWLILLYFTFGFLQTVYCPASDEPPPPIDTSLPDCADPMCFDTPGNPLGEGRINVNNEIGLTYVGLAGNFLCNARFVQKNLWSTTKGREHFTTCIVQGHVGPKDNRYEGWIFADWRPNEGWKFRVELRHRNGDGQVTYFMDKVQETALNLATYGLTHFNTISGLTARGFWLPWLTGQSSAGVYTQPIKWTALDFVFPKRSWVRPAAWPADLRTTMGLKIVPTRIVCIISR
ncbi:hypothetical protein DdX_10763 [Ditylenchus destructor]|uniref:Uncharacterized protein n=1 Tax=Ditylenchus destructor TaxID=166010 RepID=A0AAD4R5A9_9BILA|nr:hypothetical protein DdX_10763 [Ditylenchus destructor]